MLFISFVLQKFATPSSGGENSLGFNEAKPCKHEFEQHTFSFTIWNLVCKVIKVDSSIYLELEREATTILFCDVNL